MNEQFERFGYVVVDGVISGETIARLLETIALVIREHYGPSSPAGAEVSWYTQPQNVLWLVNLRFVDPLIDEVARDPKIARIACELLQTPSVSLLEDQFMNKPPGGRGVSFHQDLAYFPLRDGDRAISCWVPLDVMQLRMGPLSVVPGSHRHGIGRQPDSLHGEASFDTLVRTACPALVDPQVIDLSIGRGSAVFFDGRLIHGSGANRSERWRPALSLHYCAEPSCFDAAKLSRASAPAVFAGFADGDPIVSPRTPRIFPA